MKVVVQFVLCKLCSWTKSQTSLEASQLGAQVSNMWLFSDLESSGLVVIRLACRVLQILLGNLSGPKNKSWR